MVVVAESEVEEELRVRLDQDILRAERGSIVAEGIGDRAITCPHADDGSTDEYHGEPAKEGGDVDALASGYIWIVELTHQQ